jgi:hypothetical protein
MNLSIMHSTSKCDQQHTYLLQVFSMVLLVRFAFCCNCSTWNSVYTSEHCVHISYMCHVSGGGWSTTVRTSAVSSHPVIKIFTHQQTIPHDRIWVPKPPFHNMQGIFLVTRRTHGSVLHSYWCIADREVHTFFADDSACLTANNVWNEGK